LADDPELTVRAVRGRDPLRVVLDSRLRTPMHAKLVTSATSIPTLILHAKSANARRAAQLRAAGVQLAAVPETASRRRGQSRRKGQHSLDVEAVLRELAKRGVVRLLVEGGAQVHAALLDAGLVDRAAVFVAPRILGDMQATPLAASQVSRTLAAAFTLRDPEIVRCGNDVLFRGDLSGIESAQPTRRSASKAGPRQTTKV
jgi:diaminohydroxyphosphoribosylaminopyrimidine deaminase/5-amino-6-(5-phosphoribosylamino)uracil reductase